jgi:glycosyltransferase involved in cell wall biosynthesis
MTPVVLVTGDLVRTGGMDRANYELARWLCANAVEVHVVAFRVDDRLLSAANLKFHRVAKPLGRYALGLPLLDREGRSVARSLASRGVRVIANGTSCHRFDTNWVHYVHAAYSPGGRGLLRGLVGLRSRLRDLRDERSILRKSRLVLVNSQRTRHDVIERVGVGPARVQVVYYGVDAREFSEVTPSERFGARHTMDLDPDAPVLLFVGGLGDHRKGFDILVKAWAMLQAERFGGVLLVVGSGPRQGWWQARVEKLGLSSSVRFLGHRSDMPFVMACCDALVAPGRYEAYGLAAHEAACRGLVTLVRSDTGFAERIEGACRDVLLAPGDDPGEVHRKILHWWERREYFRASFQRLGTQLRARSWDDMSAEIWTKMLETGGRNP